MMSSSGDEVSKKSALHEDSKESGGKIDPSASRRLPSESPTKHARLQTISGNTATSVAALRRSGLRFTDVDDPNALRVQTPESGDILFGRGRGFQEHPGNQRMLKIISKHKQAYKSQKRNRKREFVEAVYDEITKDGSRFLKKLEGENCWVEVSIPISLEKVSHTLRGKRKGEEALSQPSAEEDGSGECKDLQKRRKGDTSIVAPVGGTGTGRMAPDWLTHQGFGVPLVPNPGMSMTPASMGNNSTASSIQNPSQSFLTQAQAQLGAASQLLPTNAASVMSSMPPGLSAYGAALSAYGNPFMLSSLYGVPQMAAGSNPLLGTGSGVASLYGASSLGAGGGAGHQNLATDLARLEFLRNQQLMNASAGSTNPMLASQQQSPTLPSNLLGLISAADAGPAPLGSSQLGDATVAGGGGLDTSVNKANTASEKDSAAAP